MYHNVADLINKVHVIEEKTDELKHLCDYMEAHKTVPINHERLEETKQFLVDDIQALCADIANDKGGKGE